MWPPSSILSIAPILRLIDRWFDCNLLNRKAFIKIEPKDLLKLSGIKFVNKVGRFKTTSVAGKLSAISV